MWARINSGKRNTVAHTVNILRTHGQECWHAGAPRIDRRVQIRRLLCKLPATRLLLFGLPAARALPRGGARCLRRRLPGQQRLLQVGCRGDVVRAGAAHGGHAGGQHSQQRVLPQALQGARGGGGGGSFSVAQELERIPHTDAHTRRRASSRTIRVRVAAAGGTTCRPRGTLP